MSMRLGEASNHKDLIDALNDAVERRKEARRPWDTLWWNNIALLAGDHYTRWDPTRGEFVTPPKPDHKVRLVLNHALTVARTELSKLTKAKPVMDVVSQTEEQEDIAAAKVGKQVLEGFEWKFQLRRVRKNALWWMLATGVSAVFVGFDPTNDMDGKYEYYIDPATGDPTWSEDRIQQLKQMVKDGELEKEDVVQDEPLGDIEFKVYSPFQLLPDETSLDFTELKDLITMDVVDVDIARANWGIKDIEPEADVTPGTIESTMMFRSGLTGLQTVTPQANNSVCIYTWWLPPGVYGGSYLEKGKMIRWCNKTKVLEESKGYPFIDCRIPFAFFEHVPSITSIWPESMITHIRPVNLEMDKTASQLIENKDYMSNPMWLVATQHDLPKGIVNIPGAIVRYRHVPNIPPPEQLPGIPMPAQVEDLFKMMRDQILDISGQGEVSRGGLPTGARSGVQVAYLQEEDETRLGPTAENLEDGIAVMSSLALSRVSQFYHTKRIVRMYRRDGDFEVVKFKGADIKNNTDVSVLAGSAIPKSKAARQQYVLELVQLGIERNPKRIKDMLELGMGEPDDIDKAIAQATRENHAMVQGVTTGSVPDYYDLNQGAVGQDEQAPPDSGMVPDQTAPDAAAVGPVSTGQPGGSTDLTPQISTMQQMESPAGGTRSFFEGGAAAPGPDATLPADGAGVDMETLGTQMATGEHAPSEAHKKGPVAIPVFAWHNHQAHLERHYSFMMDEEFEKIAAAHPEIVRLFNEHTAMHERVLAQQRQAQLQQLEQMKGAPGQSGDGAVSPQPQGQSDAILQNEADLKANASGGQPQ
jgi:hypothetical protein